MNLHQILNHKKIIELKYDGIFLEKPVSDIIDFDWTTILDAPPANNSKVTIQELSLISDVTHNLSEKQTKMVLLIDQDTDALFKKLLLKYKIETYPQSIIKEMYNVIRPIILNIKSYWNRPRPYQLANFYGINLKHINTDTHHTAAYPSGHTAYANLVANILYKKYPKINKTELFNIVTTVAENRVLQGVHYPTDNAASIVLGEYLFHKLQPKFEVIQ